MFTTEKLRLRNVIEKLSDDLHLAKCTLSKETEWREKLEDNYKSLIKEKRDLLKKYTYILITLSYKIQSINDLWQI